MGHFSLRERLATALADAYDDKPLAELDDRRAAAHRRTAAVLDEIARHVIAEERRHSTNQLRNHPHFDLFVRLMVDGDHESAHRLIRGEATPEVITLAERERRRQLAPTRRLREFLFGDPHPQAPTHHE